MNKKSEKDSKRSVDSECVDINRNKSKEEQNLLLDAVIGIKNVKRWYALKVTFACDTNENFATKLLDIAQDFLNKINNKSCKSQTENSSPTIITTTKKNGKTKRKKINSKQQKAEKPSKKSNKEDCTTENSSDQIISKKTNKNKIEDKSKNFNLDNEVTIKENYPKKIVSINTILETEKETSLKESTNIIQNEKVKKRNKVNTLNKTQKKENVMKTKKENEHDIRKAPELTQQNETIKIEPKQEEIPTTNNKVAIKIKLCHNCNNHHIQDKCPLDSPIGIFDAVTLDEWQEEVDNIKSEDNTNSSYAHASLPNCLQLINTNSNHGLGVAAKKDLKEFTQFGPLIGTKIKEVDISEDSSMRDIWEMCLDGGNVYINTEDLQISNWMRFIRPAPNRDDKNVTIIQKDSTLYFITVKGIKAGEELLYWQDSTVTNNKKKMEKTSCGGCNMTFSHPLYYRLHCSVFHDVRYSLTIRKYHCKICGTAVLGKDNIMKHAADLHNGQGAYQCQFCKKFFLRLNYLEMHRTYGCSANPHRSRPLCDFCGRKFCQPQKLKVHIKRMHSDLTQVLEEFQCKICLKILGSRAALHRHLKEVHQKQMDVSCSCSKCGKHFQNKSNLKIHMLTHSGIKPFKCIISSCNAAFTTKQCLQFHYKKVHNFDEEVMPKIERSVDYTFEAYSGLEENGEKKGESSNESKNDSGNLNSSMETESDIDDEASMDSKNLDDQPPDVESPTPEPEEPNSPSIPAMETNRVPPPHVDNYNVNTGNVVTMKILSKGSKKWIGDQPLHNIKPELFQIDNRLSKDELSNPVPLQEPTAVTTQTYDRTKLAEFNRHETSNASLLVEAALDSVCSEPNIDIDVSSTSNCTDALNNLYTLAPPDTLPDVTYSETVCISEPRDINLISPSVNDHISVTDELNDELRHNQNIGIDYSGFHQEDFSPENSPEIHHRTNFVRNYINNLSPSNQQNYNQIKNSSPVPVPSPPRYDFGHAHLSSDEGDGMAVQNLSLHSKPDLQLDLSIYKTPYKLEPANFQMKRPKFDDNLDKTKNYNVAGMITNATKNSYGNNSLDNEQADIQQNEMSADMDKEEETNRSKYPDDLSTDIRAKFDLDLDMRIKHYEVDNENLRPSRSIYDSNNDLDFRNKNNYDLIENKTSYETGSGVESDFRTDRNFEPLVLNSSELQGLDMSARSFHNYTNINRYHHLYPEVDRVDLRLSYSPPTPSYTHADILRVVSLDLTPPGRHSVDLSLRTHPLHQIANSRLLSDHAMQTNPHRLLDQSRLLTSDLSTARHLSGLGETTGRIISDHTTNRILSNNDQLSTNHMLSGDQRLISEDSRIISEQPRLLDGRILPPATPSGTVSPVPTFSGYSVAQNPYHPASLAPRPHVSSPTPTPYHHYSSYY